MSANQTNKKRDSSVQVAPQRLLDSEEFGLFISAERIDAPSEDKLADMHAALVVGLGALEAGSSITQAGLQVTKNTVTKAAILKKVLLGVALVGGLGTGAVLLDRDVTEIVVEASHTLEEAKPAEIMTVTRPKVEDPYEKESAMALHAALNRATKKPQSSAPNSKQSPSKDSQTTAPVQSGISPTVLAKHLSMLQHGEALLASGDWRQAGALVESLLRREKASPLRGELIGLLLRAYQRQGQGQEEGRLDDLYIHAARIYLDDPAF